VSEPTRQNEPNQRRENAQKEGPPELAQAEAAAGHHRVERKRLANPTFADATA